MQWLLSIAVGASPPLPPSPTSHLDYASVLMNALAFQAVSLMMELDTVLRCATMHLD